MTTSKYKILIASLITTLFITGSANAIWLPGGEFNITELVVHNDSLEFKLAGGSGCDRTFRLYERDPNYNVKSSALMSAYYAGHDIGVDYDGSLNDCATHLLRFRVRR